MPLPNASVFVAFVRSRSNFSGSGKTEASRPDAASQRKSLAPSGRWTPPRVTGRFVTRRQTGTDGSYRSVSRRPVTLGGVRIPSRRIFEQPAYHVADQVGRRFVAGEGERVEDRGDLLVRQGLRLLIV